MAFIIPRAIRPEVDKAIDTDTELYNQMYENKQLVYLATVRNRR